MYVLQVASEIAPYAKTGGLGDVVGGIVRPLAELGRQVAAVMPYYRRVRAQRLPLQRACQVSVKVGERTRTGTIWRGQYPGSKIPVFFVEENDLFDRDGLYGGEKGDYPDNCERFVFLSRASLEAAAALELPVDVVHAHDWQTALAPVYLKTLYKDHPRLGRARSMLTIHNLAFQGQFWHWDMSLTGLSWDLFNWKQLEFWGKLSFLKGGIVFADTLTTVSPRYAEEIQTAEHGWGMEGLLRDRAKDLHGILNGVDLEEWNPSKDPLIPARYSADDPRGKAVCKGYLRRKLSLPESPAPLFGVVSRLTEQKGIDILAASLGDFVASEAQLVILGTGSDALQRSLVDAARRWPQQIATRTTFDEGLSHEIVAGADAVLMPSRFEPCGLTQQYAQLYGTIPVVRRTGGLADTVEDGVTGFVFDQATPAGLLRGVRKALDAWRSPKAWAAMQQAGMKRDWSWVRSAREYVGLYERLAAKD